MQGVAHAQEDALEEITVTGSRIRQTSGMETPQPVTVVTPQELSVISPTNLIEGLAEMPQFYTSNTTQNTGGFFTTQGAGSLNLRGLQSKRTLQLLDGRRVVPSTIFGGPDINLFPENVIRSVETVTGGASAAYGTDAVAGVVNFILDTEFTGFKANIQHSEAANNGNNGVDKFSVGGGFSAGEKTHILLNAEKETQDPVWNTDILDYDWYTARALIENPAAGAGDSPSNPFYVQVNNVRSRNYDIDGIFHLPAAAGGAQILDSSGSPSAYVLGSPCNAHGCSTTNGGSGHESGLQTMQITPDSGRENYFGYIEHDFTDQLTVFGQGIYGKADFTSLNFGGLFPNPPGAFLDRYFTIYSGNPFLPAAIQQAMTDNSLASVPFSRIGAPEDIAHSAATTQDTETKSYTVGLNYEARGGFFDGWLTKAYFQTGTTDVKAIQRGGIRLDRIYLAADVVLDANNQPACNVTVVTAGALYPDCVPLNLFGRGNASPEAVDWVTGFEPGVAMHADGFLSATESIPYDYTSTENKQRIIEINQDVWEVSADGQISEGWAGPITMAIGYGERKEDFVQVVAVGPGGNVNADPRYRPVMANDMALGIRGVPGGNAASGNSVEIQFSNVPFARGDQSVKETFTEFFIPLVSDRPIVRQLNLSAAYRYADYSGAGGTDSWKGGLDWSINDQLRFRGTVSQDVRAATMGEKFDRTGGLANVTDYLLDAGGGVSYGITIFSNGSPDILPENAKTKTFGFVYQPLWADALSLSLDWYDVKVTDNINQSAANAVVQGCYVDGDVDLCSLITRGGPPSTENANINYISLVGVPYYNQNAVEAAGLDLEVVYNRSVGAGRAGFRLLTSYLDKRDNITSAGAITELKGRNGLPEWTAVLSGTYARGPLSTAVTVRYTDSMLINPNWNFEGNSTRWDVSDNTIDAEMIVDARVGYNFDIRDHRLNVYGTINNLFDEQPTNSLAGAFSSYFSTGTGLGVQGDLRGRRYAIGVSLDF